MRELTYGQAAREAIRQNLERDKNTLLLGIGASRGLGEGSARELEDRIIDTPPSESAFIGAAIGAAMAGFRPIVRAGMVDFMLVAMDMVANQAAKIRFGSGGQLSVPIVIIAVVGAGEHGGPHHSQSLQAWFAHNPGLKVVLPSTPYDVKGLLNTAILDPDPVIFLQHRMLSRFRGEVPEEHYTIPLGRADIKRKGKDLTIVATSFMVHKALEAAKILAEESIEAEIVDPRSLVPLDEDTILTSVRRTGRLMAIDEGHRMCGVGSEIVALAAEKALSALKAPPVRITAPQTPVPASPPLEEAYVPSVERIVGEARKLVRGL